MKDAEKSVEKSSSKIKNKFGILGKSVKDVEKDVDFLNDKLKEVPSEDVEKAESAFEKLKKKIKEAAKNTEQLNSTVESLDSKLQKLQSFAVKGFAAVGTGLAAVGVSGVKFNAQMEQYSTTFEVFTKSAEKADSILAELQEKGATTPFEFTDLADATQKMMAFGFSADEALANLDMLGNAAQGDAEKLETITTAFARMTSSGKVTLEDLNMMIDVGFNPLQQVAEDTGTSMGDLYEQISDGALEVETVTKAMQKMTSEGGQYAGLMEKQSQTLNGMLSTLSDTVQMKLGEATESVFDMAKQALPDIIEMVESIDVDKAIDGIVALAGALGGVAVVATSARGALALFNAINFVNSAGGLAAMFSGLAGSIGAVVTTIAPFVAGAIAVIAVIALISAAVIQLWNDSEEFREAVTTIIEELQEIFQNLWETVLQPIFENLLQVLNDIWVNGIQPLWETFKEFINDLTVKFSELLAAVSPIVNWFITYFGPMLVNVFNNVANVFGSVVNTILNVAGALLKNIGQVIGGVIDVFKGIIEFITGIFTGDWEKAWQGIVDIFGGIFETIGGLVAAPINGVIGLINGVIDAVNSLSIDIPDWIPVIGGQHFGVDIPTIPYLEKGGILKKGQVGLLEGSGAEAVIPLDKNKAWIRAVAKDMVQFMEPVQSNFNQTNNFYQAVETPAEYARAMRLQMRYGLAGAKK